MNETILVFNDSEIEILRNKCTNKILNLPIVKCDEKKCIAKWTFSNLSRIKRYFSDNTGKLKDCYVWTFQGDNLCLIKK